MNNQYVTPTKVHGFRFWCQKVIPLVFDDSLSYYEVLCKLTHFMNEFSESLNQTIDGLLELQEYFDELKEYVNKTLEDIIEEAYNLDGVYRLNLNATTLANPSNITDKEKERLKTILNDMITNNTVKPINVNLIADYPEFLSSIQTLYTAPYWINQIKNNQVVNIKLQTNANQKDVGYSVSTLKIYLHDYTINNGLIEKINSIYINDEHKEFLPLDGSASFTPTLPYQPATKDYVDSQSGGGSTNNLYKEIEVQDINNLTQEEQQLLVEYFQTCINDNIAYILVIKDNTNNNDMPYKICNFKNFPSFKLQTEASSGNFNCYFSIYATLQGGGEITCGDLNILVNFTLSQINGIDYFGYTGRNDNITNMISIPEVPGNIIKTVNMNGLYTPYSDDWNKLVEYLNKNKILENPQNWLMPINVYDESAKTCNLYMPYGLNNLQTNVQSQDIYLASYIRRVSNNFDINIHSLTVNVNVDVNGNIDYINYVTSNTWTEELMTGSNVFDKIYDRIHYNTYQSASMSTMQAGCIIGTSCNNINNNNTAEWEIIDVKPYFYRPGESIEYIDIDESDYSWRVDYNNGANPEGYFHFSLDAVTTNPADTAYLVLKIVSVRKTTDYTGVSWIPW